MACDLSVTNPGPIPDESLNIPEAIPALVTGMSADLSFAVGDIMFTDAVAAFELRHSGNYAEQGVANAGILNEVDVNSEWASMHTARWVAEQGIERMKKVLGDDFETTILSARAYLYAGFANRLLGEHVCDAVFDGGPAMDYKEHFKRAEAQFTEAIRLAQALGNTTIANAAYGGRASVRAWQGNWTGAVEDAMQVPDGFRFDAIFSLNSSRESLELAYETISRRELTVFGTVWASLPPDPRVPWVTTTRKGQDGKTDFWQQRKYLSEGDDVPLVKGTEMLLLRAEAALRGDGVTTAMNLINQGRAVHGLLPLTAATPEEAWEILKLERGAVLWLETRRFYDLRRWLEEGRDSTQAGRDVCFPISRNERNSNPNL